MEKSVIGLGGYAGSGKDYAAKMITELDPEYCIAKFAEPLYRICFVLCGLDPDSVRSEKAQNCFKRSWYLMKTPWRWVRIPVKGRWLLQWLGTDIVRAADSALWVARMHWTLSAGGKWVISDCRFRNEIDLVRCVHGGEWWRIQAPTNPVNSHESETQQDSITPDRILHNKFGPKFASDIRRALQAHKEDPL